MKRSNFLICLFGTYSAILLFATLISLSIIFIKLEKPTEKIVETVVETDYIYVYKEASSVKTEASSEKEEEFFLIAREYEHKIGIFDADDKLIKIIDVNTATLPEADRKLLRTGIKLYSRAELNSLIEDYSD
ncbi:MAG: hypothetical protein E7641_04010 [Ruminococcaceae bacterium]|nr:hypothetical protein [Oscillospiraceae bacterium]